MNQNLVQSLKIALLTDKNYKRSAINLQQFLKTLVPNATFAISVVAEVAVCAYEVRFALL